MNVIISSHPNVIANGNGDPAGRLHLGFLDGLRGLAAFYVVCHHFLAWSSSALPRWAQRAVSWADFGHTAVGIFIVLSGFSLMLPVARSQNGRLRGGVRLYLSRRARRILPPYYAALLLSLLPSALFSRPLTLASVLSHAVLLHNLDPRWCHDINMALWSVATEWQIYFRLSFAARPLAAVREYRDRCRSFSHWPSSACLPLRLFLCLFLVC